MNDFIKNLNAQYEYAFYEELPVFHFYQHLYSYIKIIIDSPELSKIISEQSTELKNRCKEIEEDILISFQIKEDLIDRTQKLSMYKDYINLYTQTYVSLDDWYNDEKITVDINSDIIYILGAEYFSKEDWSYYEPTSESRLKNNKQYFTNLHSKLIPFIEKENNTKTQLSFDKEKSILIIGDKKVEITLKNDKPDAHYVLEYIFDNDEGLQAKSYYSDIINAKFPKEKKLPRSILRACENIEKKVNEQAKISNFLSIKTGISGYVQVNSRYL